MAATAAHSGSRLRIGDALVALAAAAALVWLVMRVEPLGWSGPPETDIVVDGARYRLDPDGIREVETLSIEYFAAGGRAAHTIVASEIDAADRKSTRLNSSHVKISYVVFCLKKKKAYNYLLNNYSARANVS